LLVVLLFAVATTSVSAAAPDKRRVCVFKSTDPGNYDGKIRLIKDDQKTIDRHLERGNMVHDVAFTCPGPLWSGVIYPNLHYPGLEVGGICNMSDIYYACGNQEPPPPE
jgi:hypothetical protein